MSYDLRARSLGTGQVNPSRANWAETVSFRHRNDAKGKGQRILSVKPCSNDFETISEQQRSRIREHNELRRKILTVSEDDSYWVQCWVQLNQD